MHRFKKISVLLAVGLVAYFSLASPVSATSKVSTQGALGGLLKIEGDQNATAKSDVLTVEILSLEDDNQLNIENSEGCTTPTSGTNCAALVTLIITDDSGPITVQDFPPNPSGANTNVAANCVPVSSTKLVLKHVVVCESIQVSGIYVQAGAGDDSITVNYGSGNELPFDIEIHGGTGDDALKVNGNIDATILGGSGSDAVQGGSGDDKLDGGPGVKDSVRGGVGNDLLTGGPGPQGGADRFDDLYGGDGTDTVNYGDMTFALLDLDPSPAVTPPHLISGRTADLNLSLDSDNNDGQQIGAVHESDNIISGVENLVGGSGNDTFVPDSEETNNVFSGGSGVDTMNGGPGNDELNGEAGNDTMFGGNGTDTTGCGYGTAPEDGCNTGNDILNGGNGDDVMRGEDGIDTLNGGNDQDTLNGDAHNDILNGEMGNDDLFGGSGTEVAGCGYGVTQTACTTGEDALNGGEGDDDLHGEDQADTLKGGDGADELFGEEGPDTLSGEAGGDELNGDEGDDTLNGGDGLNRRCGDAGVSAYNTKIATANGLLSGSANDVPQLPCSQITDGDDTVNGGAGNDKLEGNAGNDTLDGGAEGATPPGDNCDGGPGLEQEKTVSCESGLVDPEIPSV